MKIAIDGGALCSSQTFGTYRYTGELLTTINQNSHHAYECLTFCDLPDHQSLFPHVSFRSLTPSQGWMKLRVPLQLYQQSYDVFLAVNQALPSFTNTTRSVVISRGLSFLAYPEHAGASYDRLYQQYLDYCQRADVVVVSSERVAQELERWPVSVKGKVAVIPYGIPHLFQTSRGLRREPFLLFVGNANPFKQIDRLVSIFKQIAPPDWKLFLCGPHHKYQSERVVVLPQVSAEQLVSLYQKAAAYVSVSDYESFNFPVLEALSQNCPVFGLEQAIIPEMQAYCQIATAPDELTQQLRAFVHNQVRLAPIDQNQLHAQFSWQRYLDALEQLY